MRYYIVNYKGQIECEADTYKEAEMLMNLKFSKEEIEELELEITESN